MIRASRQSRAATTSAFRAPAGQLPYAVELWNITRTAPERVIARGANAQLAHAIFAAARQEYPGRRIVLRRGSKVLQETE